MERIKGKRILVTGGAGFIGGHLVKKLVDLKAKVLVIDIKIDPKSYFAQNKLEKKCKFSFVDVRSRKAVETFFSKNKIDYVFHLAAEPIVEQALDDPYSTFDTNIMGTVNILEVVRTNKNIKGVIVASSDKAYGKTDKAYTEESPLRADHPYDTSKASADLISHAYFATYGLPVVVTRFGNVYGDGDFHFDRIIPGICKAIIKNEVLGVRSDGTYVRDYLYVKDVVSGYVFLLKNLSQIKGETFNFSSSDTLSVLDLVKKAEDVLGKKIKYKILNTAKNEIPYQHLNDLKVRRLGWKPVFNIGNSMEDVLKWYKEVL